MTADSLRRPRWRAAAGSGPWLAVSHRYLMPLALALARHHPVHVVNLPGFGLSGDPGRVLDAAEHADHFAAWLEVAGSPPVVVLGKSFGCQVAVELAVRHPDRVCGLVLVGPTMDPAARTAPRQVLRWLRDTAREDPLQLLLDTMVGDGYWPGAATLVAGPSGSGKTLMGLYFIVSGARRGEPGIIATLQEHPTQLERVAQDFGWNTGVLVVTCNPGTAHANLYIHRRCSSRGSRCSKIRAALQETVAAAGGDASPDLRRAVTSVWDKDFRQSRL